ncbi:MAG: HlyC/CorC family transporter [Acidimicrobiia bacterium]|nr:HlyC/CorC family transporter [Acidimicrobiia bacterium]
MLDSCPMPADLPLVLVFILAFGAAVFLAAAETALLRVGPARADALAETYPKRGVRLARLVNDLPQVLNTILLVALLSQIIAATVTGILTERWFGNLGVTIGSIALTIVLFIYAEAIPKTYAVRHADRVAVHLSGPIAILEWTLRPLVRVLVRVADLQAPGKGIATSPTVTEAELRRLAGFAVEEGEIEVIDGALIERAFRFGDRRTDDIMVPRTDIVGVSSEAPVTQAMEVALEVGHRRLVTFEGSLDHITGVVRLRDLAAVPDDRRHIAVGSLAVEPLAIPESSRIATLLREMQATGKHLAVVVDEYGGTAGLVTVEDIAEELLGSITADDTEEDLVVMSDDEWSVAGRLPIEDLADTLKLDIEGEWNTVGGLVVGLLGRLAAIGDTVEFENITLRVTGVRGRRVQRVHVSRTG